VTPPAFPLVDHESRVTSHGVFVTGTDTGVGKTLVSCALLAAIAARGIKVVGMKPVAAGAERSQEGWRNDDVVALRAAGNVEAPASEVNPYCFAPAIAPHLAAQEAGVVIDSAVIGRAYRALTRRAEVVVVEGAGGFLVPLAPGYDMSALGQQLALPVILVVGLRLGCLNHALLTALAIRSRGLRLAGWVANHVEPQMARAEENVRSLAADLDAPLLGRVPHGASVADAASALHIGTLLASVR